jgi:hypothetical protein
MGVSLTNVSMDSASFWIGFDSLHDDIKLLPPSLGIKSYIITPLDTNRDLQDMSSRDIRLVVLGSKAYSK